MSTNASPAQQRFVAALKGGEILRYHPSGDITVRAGEKLYRITPDGVIVGKSPPKETPEPPPFRTPRPDKPEWLTKEREAELIEVFETFGMPPRCLHGHPLCRDVSHYIRVIPQRVWVSKEKQIPVVDHTTGIQKKDASGKPMALIVWQAEQVPGEPKAVVMRLHDAVTEQKIIDFKEEDRALWQKIKAEMHKAPEAGWEKIRRGRWGTVSRDIYYSNRPVYVREKIGISATTFNPVAMVRIMDSNTIIPIELPPNIFKDISKNARRKAIRYGTPINKEREELISALIREGIREYFS